MTFQPDSGSDSGTTGSAAQDLSPSVRAEDTIANRAGEPEAAEATVFVPGRAAEVMAEGDGCWRSCSGCLELEDGQNVHGYPHSKELGCVLGGGCGECGGLGAIWDTTNYADMVDWIVAEGRGEHADGSGRDQKERIAEGSDASVPNQKAVSPTPAWLPVEAQARIAELEAALKPFAEAMPRRSDWSEVACVCREDGSPVSSFWLRGKAFNDASRVLIASQPLPPPPSLIGGEK